jgi:hypothetical protein
MILQPALRSGLLQARFRELQRRLSRQGKPHVILYPSPGNGCCLEWWAVGRPAVFDRSVVPV